MASETYNYLKLTGNPDQNCVFNIFLDMYRTKELTDVTIFCQGCKLEAHRLILSAVSPYLRQIFSNVPSDQRPVIILNDVDYSILTYIMSFIYEGEISVEISKLEELLKCADSLQIDSLVEMITNNSYEPYQIVATSVENCRETQENTEIEGNRSEANRCSDGCNDRKRRKLSKQRQAITEDVSIKTEEITTEDIEEDTVQTESLSLENSDNTTQNFATIKNGDSQLAESIDVKEEDDVENESRLDIPQTSRFPRENLQCNVCGKIFVHPYSLNHHRAVHSGRTQCHICHAVLARKYNLKMHLKARHGM